jgi:purine-binding chemotaxis protein CheW
MNSMVEENETKLPLKKGAGSENGYISEVPLAALVEQINAEMDRVTASDLYERDQILSFRPEKTLNLKQHIKFTLEDIILSVPLSSALEIGYQPKTTPLPNLPEWVVGVSNIRGEIVSIIDLKGFFKLATRQLERKKRFIIVYNQVMKVGLLVDTIAGIFLPDQAGAKSGETTNQRPEDLVLVHQSIVSDYLADVLEHENQRIHMIDMDKLLLSSRMNAFKSE